jgi:uncharacterized OsmC-like protein
VKASEGRLIAEARGEVESDDGVLVLRRIHVTYRLTLDEDADRDKVQRAFDLHPPKCPVYRSIGDQVEITLDLVTD